MDVAEDVLVQPLFGGALAMQIPSRFTDVSDFRQLPNTQEVFADALTDQSIIVEILQLADESVANAAAEFHFHSLAHDNEAFESQLDAPALSQEVDAGG